MRSGTSVFLLPLALWTTAIAHAQPAFRPAEDSPDAGATWEQCERLQGVDNDKARLACFDRWAQQQRKQQQQPRPPVAPAVATTPQPTPPATEEVRVPAPPAEAPATGGITLTAEDGCRDRQYTSLSRFWELEAGSSCGTLGFRGYRPLSVGFGFAANKPQTPTSPAPNHTGIDQPYQAQDMRIGLSLRIKLAQGLLTGEDSARRDGLWFAYSQASTWQVFNTELSRPFRTTDHEPEVMYTYPADYQLPGGWRLRYAGVGLVHQSNGQDLPYSRSWDRAYVMAGAELGNTFIITGRIWKRISENSAEDDNPDITKYLGHGELRAGWNVDRLNQLGLSVQGGKGAVSLDWFRAIGDPLKSNLRFQARLFQGYGDTLVDYNRKRTVFTVGLALVDF